MVSMFISLPNSSLGTKSSLWECQEGGLGSWLGQAVLWGMGSGTPVSPTGPLYWNGWFPVGGSIWVRIGVALLEKAGPTLGALQLSASLLLTRMDVLSPSSSACLPAPVLSVRMDRDSPSELYKLLFIMKPEKVSKTCHASTFNGIFL